MEWLTSSAATKTAASALNLALARRCLETTASPVLGATPGCWLAGIPAAGEACQSGSLNSALLNIIKR